MPWVQKLENCIDGIFENKRPASQHRMARFTLPDRLSDRVMGYLGIEDWNTISPNGLVEHIIQDHLKPSNFRAVGIPAYDIDAAKYRKIQLQSVVKEIYLRLENPDKFCQPYWSHGVRRIDMELGKEEYIEFLVRTLRYIEKQGLGEVDWGRVNKVFLQASETNVSPKSDFKDSYFSPGLYWKCLTTFGELNYRLGKTFGIKS